jgi:hypothetical protein
MLPLLNYTGNPLFKKTFKKYLIISCVGLNDWYMTQQIRKYVNEQEIDVSKLGLNTKYEKMLLDHPKITKGQCVVAQYDFTNSFNINKMATLVLRQDNKFDNLNMDFFDAVKKIDWYDPYVYIKGFEGVKPLTENWDNFVNMFELRHKIIHEMNEDIIPLSKLASMCDSTMNFIDAADFILSLEHRESVLERLGSKITLREKNARIDKAMDAAIAKGKIPPDVVKKYYEHRGYGATKKS